MHAFWFLFNDFALYTDTHITRKFSLSLCAVVALLFFILFFWLFNASLFYSLILCTCLFRIFVCAYTCTTLIFLFTDYIYYASILVVFASLLYIPFRSMFCNLKAHCVYINIYVLLFFFFLFFVYSRFGTELDCYNSKCLSIKSVFVPSENKRN